MKSFWNFYKSHSFKVLLLLPFLLGTTCWTEPLVTFEKVSIMNPPAIEAYVPDPIQVSYNEDGSYCTLQAQTGKSFSLFKEGSIPIPINYEEFRSISGTYNIWISPEGVLDLLNYFKSTICAEALIECESFESSNSIKDLPRLASIDSSIDYESEFFRNKLRRVLRETKEVLSPRFSDNLETIALKLVLLKVYDSLEQFARVALEAKSLRR